MQRAMLQPVQLDLVHTITHCLLRKPFLKIHLCMASTFLGCLETCTLSKIA